MKEDLSRIADAKRWYEENLDKYRNLEREIPGLLISVLSENEIPFLYINSRIKSLENYIEKYKHKKSENVNYDFTDIHDILGFRIITLMRSHRSEVYNELKNLLHFNPSESGDKELLLQADQVGYRAIHMIARVTSKIIAEKSYTGISKSWFEIQICSVLEHGWSEIEHKSYKFHGMLPTEIQRRLNLVAGVVELADRELERLSEEIDDYRIDVANRIRIRDLVQPLDSITLQEYLLNIFSDLPSVGFYLDDITETIIKEIKIMGINSLNEFDKLMMDKNFISLITQSQHPSLSASTAIRVLLIMSDLAKYFKEAWNHDWYTYTRDDARLMDRAGINKHLFPSEIQFMFRSIRSSEL